MRRVFVDTSAWIALINASDSLHAEALQVMELLRRQKARLVTTEFVLLEVADALSMPPTRAQTAVFIDGLRHLTSLHTVPLGQELLADGWALFKQRPDKDWGLTDCTSFEAMAQERIAEAFTSDHHFAQAGHTKLLSQP
jgi:predicted nucleic acid-binding protein